MLYGFSTLLLSDSYNWVNTAWEHENESLCYAFACAKLDLGLQKETETLEVACLGWDHVFHSKFTDKNGNDVPWMF